MSSSNRGPKSANLHVFNTLVAVAESTPSHSLGCLVNCRAIRPAGNLAGCFPRHAGGHSDRHSVCCQAGYVPENLASSRENHLDCNSSGHSADYPDSHPAGNTESSPLSSGADNPPDSSADHLVNSLPGCLDSYPANSLPRQDDLPDSGSSLLSAPSSLTDEVHSRRQRPHVVRSGMQI